MARRTGLRLAALLIFLLGLGAALALIVYYGAGDILALMTDMGWGILLVCAVHILPITATALSWRSLLRPFGASRPLLDMVWMRWVADSINLLLPVAQVGGEVVRGRLLLRGGGSKADAPLAAASIMVDMTAGFLSLLLFIVMGLGLLALGGGDDSLLRDFAYGIAIALAVLAGLYAAQRAGLVTRLVKALSKAVGRGGMETLNGGAQAFDRRLAAIYERPGAVLMCVFWRFMGWIGGAFGIWTALYLLGHPISFVEALILDAVGQAFRNMGFAVPGALGVQEAGYILGGLAIGVPEAAALALSLTKRVRDILIGVPAIASWQVVEGKGIFAPLKPKPATGE